MEWCQAMGKAHQVRPPRMDWPNVIGRMLRWRAKSRHMPKPPIRVTGTNTGLGQCSPANVMLESAAAMIGRSRISGFVSGFGNDAVANKNRFIRYEFTAICWSRQKAK